jgi:hypothetical protein
MNYMITGDNMELSKMGSMGKNNHPFHELIGKLIESNFSKNNIISNDCGRKGKVSLYCKKGKRRATNYCDVDLLILKGNKIKIIVEIEESDIRPIHIFGKFLACALSSHYRSYEMDSSVTFIQILKLKENGSKSNKSKQFDNIKESVQGIPKFSKIKSYEIFYGDKSEFEGEKGTKLINFIQKAIEGGE